MVFESFEAYLQSALKLANKEKISVYDLLYLVQAEKHKNLVTSDKIQVGIGEKIGINVEYIE